MFRIMFAVLALVIAQPSTAQASGLEPSVNFHFAWADVLRVEPVYAMVAAYESVPGCQGEVGSMPSSDTMPAHGQASSDEISGGIAAIPSNAVEPVDALNAVPSSMPQTDCVASTPVYQEQRIDGYDVEYRYRGEVYLSRLAYDPGERLRVRVSVSPAH